MPAKQNDAPSLRDTQKTDYPIIKIKVEAEKPYE